MVNNSPPQTHTEIGYRRASPVILIQTQTVLKKKLVVRILGIRETTLTESRADEMLASLDEDHHGLLQNET